MAWEGCTGFSIFGRSRSSWIEVCKANLEPKKQEKGRKAKKKKCQKDVAKKRRVKKEKVVLKKNVQFGILLPGLLNSEIAIPCTSIIIRKEHLERIQSSYALIAGRN